MRQAAEGCEASLASALELTRRLFHRSLRPQRFPGWEWQDLLQEALLRVLEAIRANRPSAAWNRDDATPEQVEGYLLRIGRNQIHELKRGPKRRHKGEDDPEQANHEEQCRYWGQAEPEELERRAATPSPEEEVLGQFAVQELEGRLLPLEVKALHLRLEGHTSAQIAGYLQVTERYARGLFERISSKLRTARHGEDRE